MGLISTCGYLPGHKPWNKNHLLKITQVYELLSVIANRTQKKGPGCSRLTTAKLQGPPSSPGGREGSQTQKNPELWRPFSSHFNYHPMHGTVPPDPWRWQENPSKSVLRVYVLSGFQFHKLLLLEPIAFDWFLFCFVLLFCFWFLVFGFCLFRAAPVAYGCSQARGPIGAVASSLCQSHSIARSKPRLGPTPQLTATPDP